MQTRRLHSGLVACLMGAAWLSVACREGEPVAEEPLDMPTIDTGSDGEDDVSDATEFDAMDTRDIEVADAEPDDGGTVPSCAALDELEPTEGFEFVSWIDPELPERGIYLLRWPRLDVGCVSYVPELEVLATRSRDDPSVWGGADMRYRVHMCHTCGEDMVLHWWTIVEGEHEPLVNVDDLNIGVQLTDATGTALPWFCAGAVLPQCPPLWRDAPVRRARRVLEAGELFVQADHNDQLREMFLLNDLVYAGREGEPLPDEYPYWNDPLDYEGALALEAMLPRLWPASMPDDEVRPDMSVDIACRLAGISIGDGGCVDRTEQAPWSPDDLLLYRYEGMESDAYFLDWVEQTWPP